MSRFLRRNDFELLFKGPYKRIKKQRNLAVGKWKAKSIENQSDQIIGFAKFSRPDADVSYHYGGIYIDEVSNGQFDESSETGFISSSSGFAACSCSASLFTSSFVSSV